MITELEMNDTCLDQVKNVSGISLYSGNNHEVINRVIEKYPVKISPYIKRLLVASEAIRKQYLPSAEELTSIGTPTPFEEGKQGSHIYGLERLYRDRVLITPHFDCPAYCRFCYKKSRVMRKKRGMTYEEISLAVTEIETMKEVRGALITGGDPMMDKDKLYFLLDRLVESTNIKEIRVGTRTLLTDPLSITDEVADKLASYIRPNFEQPENSIYLALNVHFNHPDELQSEVLEACRKLTTRGITLRNQTVLLKGINDNFTSMSHLFNLLLRNNIIVYYMNHCMPVEGSDHLRTSVQTGLDIYRRLCTESSCAIPHYVYAPSGGKVHIGPETVLTYETIEGTKYIKTEMLYNADEFEKISKKNYLPCITITKMEK